MEKLYIIIGELPKDRKILQKTDFHYCEGTSAQAYSYRDYLIMIGLCKGLWKKPERFKTDSLCIWPVFIDYTKDELTKKAIYEYADQVSEIAPNVLMVNSICKISSGHGGSVYFRNGKIQSEQPMDSDGYLIINISGN